MTGFIIKTPGKQVIRFGFYIESALLTSQAFLAILPFSKIFLHARVSGQEIWTDEAPGLNIAQENSSVFAEPGEIVIGPLSPERNRIAGFMGIFYGEGKLVDGANIFGKVFDEDMSLLKTLGEHIWKQGGQELTFEIL